MKTIGLLAVVATSALLGCGGGAASGDANDAADKSKGYGYEFENEKVSPAMAAAPETKAPEKAMVGRLAPEEIQKVVRADFGKLKACYEEALKTDAKLAGKLSVRFVINTSGAPEKVEKGDGTTLTDANMVQCSLKVFEGLKYPAPEGGIVTVIYPIEFSP